MDAVPHGKTLIVLGNGAVPQELWRNDQCMTKVSSTQLYVFSFLNLAQNHNYHLGAKIGELYGDMNCKTGEIWLMELKAKVERNSNFVDDIKLWKC